LPKIASAQVYLQFVLTISRFWLDFHFEPLGMAVLDGVVAQLVEHHNGIVGVIGSNPFGSTILSFKYLRQKTRENSVFAGSIVLWRLLTDIFGR
jgi:hypothetical protein